MRCFCVQIQSESAGSSRDVHEAGFLSMGGWCSLQLWPHREQSPLFLRTNNLFNENKRSIPSAFKETPGAPSYTHQRCYTCLSNLSALHTLETLGWPCCDLIHKQVKMWMLASRHRSETAVLLISPGPGLHTSYLLADLQPSTEPTEGRFCFSSCLCSLLSCSWFIL